MKLIPIIILVVLGFSSKSKTFRVNALEQDTTKIEYWKREARSAQARANFAALEVRKQMKLAEENARQAAMQSKACQENVEKLNSLIEQQKKTIEECKKNK